MVYLGAAVPLRLIPWEGANPSFHVTEIAGESEPSVRARLGTVTACYVGSSEGCGCLFQYGEYPELRDEDDGLEVKRAALSALRDYLRAELRFNSRIHVFACWDGDEEKQPEHRRVLTPDDLDWEDFHFLDGEASVFTSSGAAGA